MSSVSSLNCTNTFMEVGKKTLKFKTALRREDLRTTYFPPLQIAIATISFSFTVNFNVGKLEVA